MLIDIAPSGLGNIAPYPRALEDYPAFYDAQAHGPGHALNPATAKPYEPQWVPRGDYARVLAEYWADGPDSETPPGHWFVILNAVNDHEALARQLGGAGPELDPLEWDVKAYFTLGGAMHDAAIAAWGIKGAHRTGATDADAAVGGAEPGRRSRGVARRRIALTRRRTAAWHGAEQAPSLAAQDRDRAAGGADYRRPGTVGAGRSGARRRSGGVPTRRPRCVVRRARMIVDVIDTATEGCDDAR